QGPEALARLDRALGDQDPVVPGADGAGDDLGVLVVDELAARAHQALAVVAVGAALLEMVARVPRKPRPVRLDWGPHAPRLERIPPRQKPLISLDRGPL